MEYCSHEVDEFKGARAAGCCTRRWAKVIDDDGVHCVRRIQLIPGDVACDCNAGITVELCGDAIESNAVHSRVGIVGDGQV